MSEPEPVLRIDDLTVAFETIEGKYSALNGVNLEIRPSEIMGLVGESGCGKSSLALAVIGLLPVPPAKVLHGNITFKGNDIVKYTEEAVEKVRGTGISMVFQEPLTSLNPLFTVGDQITEAITVRLQRENATYTKKTAQAEGIGWLRKVGIPDPEGAFHRYPHELSGGMRQRVMIAMALSASPSLMIADEPTSALDVTTQAQILKLTRKLVEEVKASVLFITHDLAVIAQIADRIAVMYTGMVVEEGTTIDIFEKPLHPYTRALLASYPGKESINEPLKVIPGQVPNLTRIPQGCPFHPRCSYAREECRTERPRLKEVSGHKVACVLY
jgi:oligopeptide/dipeptide ABC transporter ATP-binding protein